MAMRADDEVGAGRRRQAADEFERRRHVGLSLPREVKARILEAAEVLEWPLGQWVLTAAAEQGPRLRRALGAVPDVRRRAAVRDATFTAVYVSLDERDELDDQAVACGLNRSAFVTAVARLALGEDLAAALAELGFDDVGPSRG